MAKRPIDAVKTANASYSLENDLRIESLAYTGSSDFKGTGNRADNVITGGAGNDTLDGLAGADTLVGGMGNDTYIVDDTDDVVTEKAGEGTDAVRTTLASYSITALANVENLTYAGSSDFHGTGNDLANLILGGSGNDVLDGGSGTDTMIGGKGDDTYVVDDIGDVVTEAAGEGVDTIETDVVTYRADILGYVSTRFSLMAFAQVENLTYTGTSDFKGYGNDLDNVIIGGAGRDILDGGAGADTLIGGDGNDTYYIDDESDAIVETENGGGDFAWVPFSSVDLSDFYARHGNVEGVGYTGRSDFTAHGTEGADDISGGIGNDSIYGYGGDDFLAGNDGGNDLIDAGDGNDYIWTNFATDADTSRGGAGNDYIWDSLGDGEVWGDDNDMQAGNDTLRGVSGDDSLFGLAGNDWLEGGKGDDLLQGGRGSDSLEGGAGDDRIESANGMGGDEGDVDTMNGGAGTDTFVYQAGGVATIEDFADGETLVLSFRDVLDTSNVHVAYDAASKDSTITFEGYDATLNHVVMQDFDATTLDIAVSGSDLMLA